MTTDKKTQEAANKAAIEAFKKKVVTINYGPSTTSTPKKLDKTEYWKRAKEVGKNPISNGSTPSRPLHAA
jgi:hypothetical protein